jgi:hypothetical protein
MDANGKIELNTHSMFDPRVSELMRKCFSNNLGFAIDLGAVYRINQQIRVSASITDLGFIRWKSSILNMSIKPPDEEYYEFSGFTIDQFMDFFNNGIRVNIDTIVNRNLVLKEIKPYTTMLTSKMMLDCYFDLTPSNRFILQFKGYFLGKHFLPQFTVAYNGSFWNAIDVVISYTIMKNSFTNLGVGFGFRMWPIHLYMGTDNVLAAINVFNATKVNATVGLLVDFPFKAKIKEAELKSIFKKKEISEDSLN